MSIRDDIEPIALRAESGDQNAMAQAFQHFRQSLKQAVVMRIDHRLRARIDPSDVVQDAYLDAARRLDEYSKDPQRMPLALWLRFLTAQRLVDLQRRHLGAQMRGAGIEVPLDIVLSMPTSSVWLANQIVDRSKSGSSAAILVEVRQRVRHALETMDPLDREVLAMRHFELLTNGEVAHALGLSESAACNRYVRALKRLKQILLPLSLE